MMALTALEGQVHHIPLSQQIKAQGHQMVRPYHNFSLIPINNLIANIHNIHKGKIGIMERL